MSELLTALSDLLQAVGNILAVLWNLVLAWLPILLALLPVGLWCAWWLWAVNWKKTWPVLRQGAWAPVLLLMFTAALAWSRLAPAPCDCMGVTIPNFWWQLGGVSALVAVALFCGWLQGYFGWTPPEINLEPPAAPHGHHHGNGHASHGHH